MKNFEISFNFEGQHYLADVSVIQGRGHLQYTIAPRDEDLLARHPAQVIREFPGNPLQPAFPGATEEAKKYADAVLSALKKSLEKA